jgi:RNA polymerase sigma-70 factor (ECF subfamily)
MDETGTDDLIARIRSGEIDRYAELVRRHQQDVRRVVGALLRDLRSTEDLVQQTFVDAYRHLDRFRPGADFAAWLKGIARNLARMEIRARTREGRRLDAYQALLEIRWREEDRAHRRETAVGDALRECREAVGGDAALALSMRYVQGRPFGEISDRLGRSVQAVQQLLFRVRLSLRECVRRRLLEP